MNNIETIRKNILRIADPNDDYTIEKFNEEFVQNDELVIDTSAYKINLEFRNESNNEDPAYATDGASGFDVRANLQEDFILESGNVGIIPTGLFFNIPDNFEIQVRSRSGLAAKNAVIVLNSPGTIDSDYLGELKIILINLGKESFKISNGDRIAQCVLAPALTNKVVNLNRVKEITKITERNTGGFGSTGLR